MKKKDISSSSPTLHFDVCIVGAGPAGLACLSAIREPYSLDNLTPVEVERANRSVKRHHRPLSVCVIDPYASSSLADGNDDDTTGGWMHNWKQNFELLQIQHLRSPALAHPNLFDKHALLAYACRRQQQHGKNKDNVDDDGLLYESGCLDMKKLLGLGQTQVGLWKLPSTKLFNDFCDDMTRTLSHTLITGHVAQLSKDDQQASDGSFRIEIVNNDDSSHQYITASNVILAMGAIGKPIVPHGFDLGHPRVFCWNDPRAYETTTTATTTEIPPQQVQQQQQQQQQQHQKKQQILVIGGGLTAVQVALRVVKDGNDCVLCSRRPLQQRHFDIPVEWFDLRSTNKCLADFYHYTMQERLEQIKQARDGGSIPPMYLKRLAEVCSNSNSNNNNHGRLTCWVGEVECCDNDGEKTQKRTVTITHKGMEHVFDKVILSCGVQPQCHESPLVRHVLDQWPIAMHGGLPAITQDLRWQQGCNIFVAGALAALQVGPDAGNLMGIRRAAFLIANSLDCRCWLREKALSNPFEALMMDDSDSDTEPASDDDDDDASSCSTCAEVVVEDDDDDDDEL